MPPAVDSPRPRGLQLAYALVAALAATLAISLARRSELGIFAALAGLTTWMFVVAAVNTLPRLPFYGRGIAAGAGLALTVALPVAFLVYRKPGFGGATDSTLQLAAVALSILGFGFYFLATYGEHVAREQPASTLATLVPLARLVAAGHALTVGALLAWLYAQRSWLHAVEVALNLATAIVVAETLLHAIARLYQPARLRALDTVFGGSVIVPAVFGQRGPLRSLGATLEKTFGLTLADTWLVQLGRILLAPLVLLGLIGAWASTAVTRVPVESRGVLLERGAFAATALNPGLHVHSPWPWGRVLLVPTERVQELSVGFERDLAGPVLWAEKHFEGEQNLLVGQGEELLTINLPIQFRIRDAVAYARRVSDARVTLEALAFRELLALTTQHTAFGLMTTDRIEVTERLHRNLQAACDRLQLGLEIVFVGFKDVHPPVPVAPAYQDVISAEEQRAAIVDLARTYAAQAKIAAEVSAAQLKLQARTAATERRARASGEAARFLAPLAAYQNQPQVFMTRRRLETIEATLGEVRQLILLPTSVRARANFFLGLDSPTPLPGGAPR